MWVAPESAQHSESGSSESGEKTQPGVRESTSDAMSESLDDMEGVQLVFEAVDWFSLGDIVTWLLYLGLTACLYNFVPLPVRTPRSSR